LPGIAFKRAWVVLAGAALALVSVSAGCDWFDDPIEANLLPDTAMESCPAPGELLAGEDAARDVVGGDVRQHVGAVHLAVDGDDLDLGLRGLLDHGLGRVGVAGVEQNDADVLLDEVVDLPGLLGRIVLGVGNDELIAEFLGLGLGALLEGDEERIVERGDRESDLLGRGRAARAAGEESRAEGDGGGDGDGLLHSFLL